MLTKKTIGLALLALLSWVVLDAVRWLVVLQPSTIDGGDLLALVILMSFIALLRQLAK